MSYDNAGWKEKEVLHWQPRALSLEREAEKRFVPSRWKHLHNILRGPPTIT